MRKSISILLCAILLLGLLPTAALANFSPNPGVYTQLIGDVPTGYIGVTKEFDGDRFLCAYYAVSYSSPQACTVYYYQDKVNNPVEFHFEDSKNTKDS